MNHRMNADFHIWQPDDGRSYEPFGPVLFLDE